MASIERFGGSIDKHIGDCVMAVFGAPVAHGNDAERAARAALAIRDAMPDLSARSGDDLNVHIGIASRPGGGQHGSAGAPEYSVTGDSVNLASRLTDAAPTGEILISDAVRPCCRQACLPRGRHARRSRAWRSRSRAWRLIGFGEAARRGSAVRRQARRAHPVQSRARRLSRSGTGQPSWSAARRGSARRGWSRSSRRRRRTPGFACHLSLVLDFGAGTRAGRDPRAGAQPARAARRQRPGCGAGGARAGAGRRSRRRRPPVYLNDLLDLPQPTALRALYDAMDNATRNRGKRETVAALVRRRARCSRSCSWSRTCTGRTGRPWMIWRRLPRRSRVARRSWS